MNISFDTPQEKQRLIALLANAVCQTHLARASMKAGASGDALARYFAVDRHEAARAFGMLPEDLKTEVLADASANEADPPGK